MSFLRFRTSEIIELGVYLGPCAYELEVGYDSFTGVASKINYFLKIFIHKKNIKLSQLDKQNSR